MNEGVFWNSFSESISLLKKINLLKEKNVHKRIPYSIVCNEYSRSNNYSEIYHGLVDNRDYDILLYDNSMFQMSISSGEARLMFIQNPQVFISFEDFLEKNEINHTDESIDSLKEMFYDDYSQTLDEMNLNSGAVYFRYDVDARSRQGNENIHAYTHLHIGLNNYIRIPVGKYLTPLAFTTFVIRHVYYDTWVDAIRKSLINLNYKRQCEDLPADKWTDSEKKDLHLF